MNKSALVPTLIAMDPETQETDESKVCPCALARSASQCHCAKHTVLYCTQFSLNVHEIFARFQVVYESLVCIDFIDQVSGATGKDKLVSEDPFLAAQSRIWADKVNRDCCSPYYGVLVRKEDSERRESFEKLISGLEVRQFMNCAVDRCRCLACC